jgi:O-antigen ligase
MKHRKIRKGVSKYIRERLGKLIDNDTDLEPRMFDYILSASKDYAEEFHPFYVQLLLESGLTLEESLALLAEGALRPN